MPVRRDTKTLNMATLTRMSMSDKRYDQISAQVRQSYPNSCILWVDIIDNPTLEKLYQQRLDSLKTKRGANIVTEAELFHGTSEECAELIARNGYDVSCNRVAAYGLGTYFGASARTSMMYMKDNKEKVSFMLLNKVIMGSKFRYGNHQAINTDVHDNSVDNLGRPEIVVSPYNDGARPLYIIAFYRYAK